jgi:hypothetical protein
VNKIIFVIGLTIFLIPVFSGCTENNNSNDQAVIGNFAGTWTGHLVSAFKERTVNVTGLAFNGETVDITMISDRGTQTMTYSLNVEGDKLVLEAIFDNEGSPRGRPPPDGGQTSRTITYTYRFNEKYDVLYLDGTEFKKM